MKANQIIFTVIFVLSSVLGANLYASSLGAFNDTFKISADATAVSSKNVAKSWNIVYGDSNRPVRVFLKQTKSGDEYIVRCGYFEVKYVNGSKGFGVREIHGSDQTVPADLNYKVLNSIKLNSQKIISGSKIEDAQVLEMIASFLPELVNDEFKNILN
ncbi:hypothetical protein [Mangrovibacterium sp.]|uniref:hypothetical protein n=1 Tax=Mangrovibacterium sp. TaxID=1961364 RepID=UPI00356291D6